MTSNQKQMAVLFDVENISPENLFTPLFSKLAQRGFQAYPRKLVFNTVTQLRKTYLGNAIKTHHLDLICTYSSVGKNVADFRLYMEVLDMLYKHPEVTGYCIVSGDADYAELVIKLKHENKYTIGIGSNAKCKPEYTRLFDEFYFIEELIKQPEPAPVAKEAEKNSAKENEGTAAKKTKAETKPEAKKEVRTKSEVKKETKAKPEAKPKQEAAQKAVKPAEKKKKAEPENAAEVKAEEKKPGKAKPKKSPSVPAPTEKKEEEIVRTEKDKNDSFFAELRAEIDKIGVEFLKKNQTEMFYSTLVQELKNRSYYLESFNKITLEDIEKCGYPIQRKEDGNKGTAFIDLKKEPQTI